MHGVKLSINVHCVVLFVSSSIFSGGITVFLCFILYDVTCDPFKSFKLNMNPKYDLA